MSDIFGECRAESRPAAEIGNSVLNEVRGVRGLVSPGAVGTVSRGSRRAGNQPGRSAGESVRSAAGAGQLGQIRHPSPFGMKILTFWWLVILLPVVGGTGRGGVGGSGVLDSTSWLSSAAVVTSVSPDSVISRCLPGAAR